MVGHITWSNGASAHLREKSLSQHVGSTYTALRIGFAVLSAALPIVLYVVSRLRSPGLELQNSMSAYYHAGSGAVRDEFVGILCAVGVFLYLYKGYTARENIALNVAGVSIVGCALVPMQWNCGASCSSYSIHDILGFIFFLAIAYVCLFRAADTLSLIPERKSAQRFKSSYQIIGGLLILSPVVAFVLTLTVPGIFIFVAEAFGVWLFTSYWVLKSVEISKTETERLALEGKLKSVEAKKSYGRVDVKIIPATAPRALEAA
jgi:hypothetical protein